MNKSERLKLWLPEGTDPLEVSKLSENFKILDSAAVAGAKVKCIAVKSSTTWTVPDTALRNKFQVLCQGGGGSGGSSADTVYKNAYSGGGGGGGQAKIVDLTLTPGEEIVLTVGGAGGSTSFGSYAAASAGEKGKDAGDYVNGSDGAMGGVDAGGTSLGLIERTLGIFWPITDRVGPRYGINGTFGTRGFGIGSGGGGGGGLDIGDGMRASNGGTTTAGSIPGYYFGGFGGSGYGAGGGGAPRKYALGSGQGYTGGSAGSGAPGIILIAWEEA